MNYATNPMLVPRTYCLIELPKELLKHPDIVRAYIAADCLPVPNGWGGLNAPEFISHGRQDWDTDIILNKIRRGNTWKE